MLVGFVYLHEGVLINIVAVNVCQEETNIIYDVLDDLYQFWLHVMRTRNVRINLYASWAERNLHSFRGGCANIFMV